MAKFTVTLDECEVRGYKKYLKIVDDIKNPTNKDIQKELNGIISGTINSPRESVSNYIQDEREKSGKNN